MGHTMGFVWLYISDYKLLIGSAVAFRKQFPPRQPSGRLVLGVLDGDRNVTMHAWW
jgi:hypothetical protein